jgi:hypothetical protein
MASRKARLVPLAAIVAASALVAGTLAYTNFAPEKANEFFGTGNLGLRLHDDYAKPADTVVGQAVNKDVYVENHGQYTTFVRVKLVEHMTRVSDGVTSSLVATSQEDDTSTWFTYVPGRNDDPFRQYYSLTLGSAQGKYYLPTDLRDTTESGQTSDADNQLDYTNTDPDHRLPAGWAGADHTDVYGAGDVGYKSAEDGGTGDELTKPHNKFGAGVAATPASTVMSLADWLKDQAAGTTHTNVWVWDTDGWFYWVGDKAGAPVGLEEGQVTGLLLDAVTLTAKPASQTWYYGLSAQLEAVTLEDQFAFDDLKADRTISAEAWQLLRVIGGFWDVSAAGRAAALAAYAAVPGQTTGTRVATVPLTLDVTGWFDQAHGETTYALGPATTAKGTLTLVNGVLAYTPTAAEAGTRPTIEVVATHGSETASVTITVNVSQTANLALGSYTLHAADSTGYMSLTAAGLDWYIIDIGGDAYGDGSTADDEGVVYLLAKTLLSSGARRYDAASNDWDTSELKGWLNDDSAGFLKTLTDADAAFAGKILTTRLWTAQTASLQDYVEGDSKIFLPSPEEAFGVVQDLTTGDTNAGYSTPPRKADLTKNLYPNEGQIFDTAVLAVPGASLSRYWMRGPGRREDNYGASITGVGGTTPIANLTQGIRIVSGTTEDGVRPVLRVNLLAGS